MFPELLTMVRGQQDDGSIVNAMVFQPHDEPAKCPVHIRKVVVVEVPQAVAKVYAICFLPQIIMHIHQVEKGKEPFPLDMLRNGILGPAEHFVGRNRVLITGGP